MSSSKDIRFLILKSFSFKYILKILIPAISMIAMIMITATLTGIPASNFTRDTVAIVKVNPSVGILSNIGILLWSATVGICAFTTYSLRSTENNKSYYFLLFSTFISFYLMVDDFFLVHDYIAPKFFGIGEKTIFSLLGIILLGYLVSFKEIIYQTNFTILFIALSFFSISMVTDTIFTSWMSGLGDNKYYIEDGSKWIGIVFWFAYYVETSSQLLIKKKEA